MKNIESSSREKNTVLNAKKSGDEKTAMPYTRNVESSDKKTATPSMRDVVSSNENTTTPSIVPNKSIEGTIVELITKKGKSDIKRKNFLQHDRKCRRHRAIVDYFWCAGVLRPSLGVAISRSLAQTPSRHWSVCSTEWTMLPLCIRTLVQRWILSWRKNWSIY